MIRMKYLLFPSEDIQLKTLTVMIGEMIDAKK